MFSCFALWPTEFNLGQLCDHKIQTMLRSTDLLECVASEPQRLFYHDLSILGFQVHATPSFHVNAKDPNPGPYVYVQNIL